MQDVIMVSIVDADKYMRTLAVYQERNNEVAAEIDGARGSLPQMQRGMAAMEEAVAPTPLSTLAAEGRATESLQDASQTQMLAQSTPLHLMETMTSNLKTLTETQKSLAETMLQMKESLITRINDQTQKLQTTTNTIATDMTTLRTDMRALIDERVAMALKSQNAPENENPVWSVKEESELKKAIQLYRRGVTKQVDWRKIQEVMKAQGFHRSIPGLRGKAVTNKWLQPAAIHPLPSRVRDNAVIVAPDAMPPQQPQPSHKASETAATKTVSFAELNNSFRTSIQPLSRSTGGSAAAPATQTPQILPPEIVFNGLNKKADDLVGTVVRAKWNHKGCQARGEYFQARIISMEVFNGKPIYNILWQDRSPVDRIKEPWEMLYPRQVVSQIGNSAFYMVQFQTIKGKNHGQLFQTPRSSIPNQLIDDFRTNKDMANVILDVSQKAHAALTEGFKRGLEEALPGETRCPKRQAVFTTDALVAGGHRRAAALKMTNPGCYRDKGSDEEFEEMEA